MDGQDRMRQGCWCNKLGRTWVKSDTGGVEEGAGALSILLWLVRNQVCSHRCADLNQVWSRHPALLLPLDCTEGTLCEKETMQSQQQSTLVCPISNDNNSCHAPKRDFRDDPKPTGEITCPIWAGNGIHWEVLESMAEDKDTGVSSSGSCHHNPTSSENWIDGRMYDGVYRCCSMFLDQDRWPVSPWFPVIVLATLSYTCWQ